MELAEDHVEAKNSDTEFDLGDLKSVETQVVSGTNYKLTYENSEGEVTEITVYSQPWTDTLEVTGFTLRLYPDDEFVRQIVMD